MGVWGERRILRKGSCKGKERAKLTANTKQIRELDSLANRKTVIKLKLNRLNTFHNHYDLDSRTVKKQDFYSC